MIKRKDLTDIGDEDYRQRRDEFIQCQNCCLEFGGTRGDFWDLSLDHVLICPDCGLRDALAIVRKKISYEIVKQ